MKKLLYAGSELVTGDEIALAVMRYSEALADAGTAETISVPILESDGARGTAMILIGPSSQIVAEDAHSEIDDLIDSSVVEELNAKTRRLRPVAVADSEPSETTAWLEDL